MTLPASGPISLSQVNVELELSATATISLNQANVRRLAGVPSGQISMQDLRGKSNDVSVQYLVVAGGGGGGNNDSNASGGGGAGGLLTNTIAVPATASYLVTVGAGGPGGANNGSNSVFSSITATGGGHGGSGSFTRNGNSGGSGRQRGCCSISTDFRRGQRACGGCESSDLAAHFRN